MKVISHNAKLKNNKSFHRYNNIVGVPNSKIIRLNKNAKKSTVSNQMAYSA